jgi:hypothetical protein
MNVDDRIMNPAAGFTAQTATNIDVQSHSVMGRLNILFNPW